MKNIDIVLPVYNEEKGLPSFHNVLQDVLSRMKERYHFQIIYVVDKCKDRSYQVVEDLVKQSDNTVGVQLSARFGHQNSLMAGFSLCTGDAVIMMDSDLEHPPEVIAKLLEQFENGYEIVYTKRIYNKKVGLLKRASSKLYYKLVNSLTNVEIGESSADFRLISAKVLDVLKNSIHEQNPFLRGLFPWMGFKHTFVEFTSGQRAAGRSHYSLMRMLKLGLDGITSFSSRPLMLSIYAGIFFSILSFAYLIYIIVGYLLGGATPAGWVTTISIVGFMGSLQLIAMGIMGIYVGKMFEEVKRRPVFIIENIIQNEERAGGQLEHGDSIN
ncbi:MAG: glycosyltransferase family 2 protein [Suipraeoptans sp.]